MDPEERNRFHNLLAEIGEEVVVILSTHIVDDVHDLCPNMAIIADGEIISQGTPGDLTKELDGAVWRKAIDKAETEDYKLNYNVISSHLSLGKTIIYVHSPDNPGEGFEAALPNLEHVYFAAIAQNRNSAEAAA